MRFLALLRGINVGGHKKVPMAELRAVAQGLGLTNVATYIQSGNLLFDAPAGAAKHEAALEAALADHFGFEVAVLVRTAKQVRALPAANPFRAEAAATPKLVMLMLTKAAPRADAPVALAERATADERAALAGGALWLHLPNGSARSKWTPALLARLAGSTTTTRNWNTLLKLVELL